MHYDSTDHDSIAEQLRAEREQLILAWEKLEQEQRKLALTCEIHLRPPEPKVPSTPTTEQHPLNLTNRAPAPLTAAPDAGVKAKSMAANTFRFLQKEFDNNPNRKHPRV